MTKSERAQLQARRHHSLSIKYFALGCALGCLFLIAVALLCLSFNA